MGRASRFVGNPRTARSQAKILSRVDQVAAVSLSIEHGRAFSPSHRPGDRADLCPRCNPAIAGQLPTPPVPKPFRPAPPEQVAVKREQKPQPPAGVTPRKRRARVEPDAKRTAFCTTVCSPTEKSEMLAAAKSARVSFSTWARIVLLREARGA